MNDRSLMTMMMMEAGNKVATASNNNIFARVDRGPKPISIFLRELHKEVFELFQMFWCAGALARLLIDMDCGLTMAGYK
jgi:hypothetical protein